MIKKAQESQESPVGSRNDTGKKADSSSNNWRRHTGARQTSATSLDTAAQHIPPISHHIRLHGVSSILSTSTLFVHNRKLVNSLNLLRDWSTTLLYCWKMCRPAGRRRGAKPYLGWKPDKDWSLQRKAVREQNEHGERGVDVRAACTGNTAGVLGRSCFACSSRACVRFRHWVGSQ